jgi:hypothetical protein
MMVNQSAARVLINREATGILNFKGANKRDMFLPGNCDDTVLKIIDLSGWREDYEQIRANVLGATQ